MRNTFPQEVAYGHKIKPLSGKLKTKQKKMFSGALAENIVKAESLHGVKNNWAYIQVKMPTYNYYMKSKKQPHLAWENINNKSWVPGRIL